MRFCLSAALLLLLLAPAACGPLELVVRAGQSPRCVVEELAERGLALINWEVELDQPLAFTVYSPNGSVIHEQASGTRERLGFQAGEAGDYKACFAVVEAAPAADAHPVAEHHATAEDGAQQADPPPPPPPPPPPADVRLRVEWLTGVGARDWGAVAKKDHLKEISASLVELEAELTAVYQEMLAMRAREEVMRGTSERVNAKVAWFSVLSLFVSCTLAAWQLFYIRRFLEKKKII